MSVHLHDYIPLCTPVIGDEERLIVSETMKTDWITTVGPNNNAFEQEFSAALCPGSFSVAVNSGTAALHLAFRLFDVKPNDEILCSSFTFIASISSAVYMGAIPTFIDSEADSWNMDPELLAAELEKRKKANRLPKLVVLTHVYGQSADLTKIVKICESYRVPLIEDAAEALGTTNNGKQVGFSGTVGVFSFNGNKMLTTGGGGMLCTRDKTLAERAQYLAFQAKVPGLDYIHEELGYNFKLSNVLAAIGRVQLTKLTEIAKIKADIYQRYQVAFSKTLGLSMMPAPKNFKSTSSNWLSVLRISSEHFSVSRHELIHRMHEAGVQLRATWKPMHTQPIFQGKCYTIGGEVCEAIFDETLCLPSSLSLDADTQQRVIDSLLKILHGKEVSKKTHLPVYHFPYHE